MPDNVDPLTKQSISALDGWFSLLKTLREDTEASVKSYQQDPQNQYLRRTLVRTAWAMIEGVTFGFKHWILTCCDLTNESLTPEERDLLTEKRFEVLDDGQVKVSTSYKKTTDNIKRTFRLGADKLAIGWQPEFSTPKWNSLISSLDKRHKITHPKSGRDLTVSDSEIESTCAAVSWLLEEFNSFNENYHAYVAKSSVYSE